LIDAVTQALAAPPFAVIDADLTDEFKRRLNDAIVHASTQAADTSPYARPLLVCIGGDGTVSLAFDALLAPESVTLSLVPCGSGNDLAHAIGLSTTRQALELLRSGGERAIDYGTVNGRRFLNCVGMGLDAEVGAMAKRIRGSRLLKGFSYYLAALRGLLMVKPVAATVRTPEVELRFEDLVMLTVGNGPWYGGGFRGAPGASLDDGAFDCYAFRDPRGLGARFALMQRIRAGAHPTEPNVSELRTAHLDASFERDIAMHVDGELTHGREVHVELVRLGAALIAPKV
jgi:YegS/Rv2252/BmrU family lipid kinase